MEPQTIIIDNFSGMLTRKNDGTMNSGYAKYATSYNYNPFTNPGGLSFMDTIREIDGLGGCVMCGKPRMEGNILYVYAVSYTGTQGILYKIQVNKPSTNNPDYDDPQLVTNLNVGNPTFNFGGSMEFFEDKIVIGHDAGITLIDFDGSNQVLLTGPILSVPRPFKIFQGKLFFGNGNNIGEIDSSLTITTEQRLDPSFPDDFQVVDIDVTQDGVYLVIATTQVGLNPPNLFSSGVNEYQAASLNSNILYWNGTDISFTSLKSQPNFNISAYKTFAQNEFYFGYDTFGSAMMLGGQKMTTLPFAQAPFFQSKGSIGNAVLWGNAEYINGELLYSIHMYGNDDNDMQPGHYRPIALPPDLTEKNILHVPFMLQVSNNAFGTSFNNYQNNQFGYGKIYLSTIEKSPTSQILHRFYAIDMFPTGTKQSMQGVYETQNQLFGKKVSTKEVRIYLNPVTDDTEFTIDLIGIDGDPIANASQVISVASGKVNLGETIAQFNPAHLPTPSLGVRVTNTGTLTPDIRKIELDVVPQGK